MTFCNDNFETLETLPQEFLDQFYKYASNNLIKLHMFISTPFATEYERDVETSRISFVANIGGKSIAILYLIHNLMFIIGLMGLCMGFSFVSFAEILYYVGQCMCFKSRMKK